VRGVYEKLRAARNSYCGIVNKSNTRLSAVDLIVAKAAIILYELWRMSLRSAIFYRDDRW